jgi:hypothetical protein
VSAKFRPTLILMLTVLVLQRVSPGQTLPPAIKWIPQDAVICLELSEPKALLELLAGEKATAAITALPLYQQQVSKPQFQELLNLVNFMETALDTDWHTGLAKLTGGGITFAVCPEETVLLIIDAEDEYMLRKPRNKVSPAGSHLRSTKMSPHGRSTAKKRMRSSASGSYLPTARKDSRPSWSFALKQKAQVWRRNPAIRPRNARRNLMPWRQPLLTSGF